jgi:putative Mn2+ efflux pump MntP
MLSIATSIDALAVGVSMAFLRISIWMPSLVIGLVTAVLTVAGICFAGKMGRRFGMWADLFGGVVLIAIGARILISHHFCG